MLLFRCHRRLPLKPAPDVELRSVSIRQRRKLVYTRAHSGWRRRQTSLSLRMHSSACAIRNVDNDIGRTVVATLFPTTTPAATTPALAMAPVAPSSVTT